MADSPQAKGTPSCTPRNLAAEAQSPTGGTIGGGGGAGEGVAQKEGSNNNTNNTLVSGIDKWKAIRKQWQTPTINSRKPKIGEVTAKNIDVELVIERIFAAKGGGELETSVPLGQMIDILIDFWEADGLYD